MQKRAEYLMDEFISISNRSMGDEATYSATNSSLRSSYVSCDLALVGSQKI